MSIVPPAKLPKATRRRRKRPKFGPSRGRKAATGCSRRSSRADRAAQGGDSKSPAGMPGFSFGARSALVLVADLVRAVRGVHADEVALVRREEADTAISGDRRKTLAVRIEAAILRAAFVVRAVAGGERR